MHNEELYDLYSSPNIIRFIKSRIMGWARHVARMGDRRSAYVVIIRRRERKRTFGRTRRIWEYKIIKYFQGVMDWIDPAEYRDW